MLADSGALHEGQHVVHTSGRHGLAVLEPARAVGARVAAMHPAMTFTGTAVDLDRLAGTVFGLTAEAAERGFVESLVADLGGTPMWVPEEMRTLYHAGLAHGANHLVTLVTEAMEILSAAGAADPAGTLRPLLTAALDNALEQGDAALTGPIVRGDLGTVRAHLEDITANAPADPGLLRRPGPRHPRPRRDGRPRRADPRRPDPRPARRRRGRPEPARSSMTNPPLLAHTPRGARRAALGRTRTRPQGRLRADHGRPPRGPREPAARRP